MTTFKQVEDGHRAKFILLASTIPAGEIAYRWADATKIIIEHTEVDEAFSGKGFGKQLVLRVVELAKEKGIKIIPLCPYAKRIMESDQELQMMMYK